MPLLFSYGTLQEEAVQRELFGRILAGRAATLLGFQQEMIAVSDAAFAQTSGKTHHAILRRSPDPKAKVHGMVFAVTEAELELADRYEPVEYTRVLAGIAAGGQAWVYVDSNPDV